jgi:hypothetical protein
MLALRMLLKSSWWVAQMLGAHHQSPLITEFRTSHLFKEQCRFQFGKHRIG